MTQIPEKASQHASIYAGGMASRELPTFRAGDTIVFNGVSLRVIATGAMALQEGVVEVAHVQDAGPSDGSHPGLDIPPQLARKIADYLGITEGKPYTLQRGDAEWITQVASDHSGLREGAAFMASLVGTKPESALGFIGTPETP